MSDGLGLLRIALASAKKEGITEAQFAKDVLYVEATTLWRIKDRQRALKPQERMWLRTFIAGHKIRMAAK
jgi:hypothetical protein